MFNYSEHYWILNEDLIFVQYIDMFKYNEHLELLNMPTPAQEIIEKAIGALEKETNAQVVKELLENTPGDHGADAELWIKLPDRENIKFRVQVKRTITEAVAIRLARDLADNLQNFLFVTNYAHRKIATMMKELGIQFIDTAGNMYINYPPTLIFIHGYPRVDYAYALTYEEVMFGPAGLRVIFALLCKHELCNENYRIIKIAADVALGTVANIMKELTQKGYLIKQTNKQNKLIRRKELLDKWVDAYIEKLRPKKIIGQFRGVKPDFWQQTNLTPLEALWGGETAAYLMTRYLKPEITTIYADKPFNNLILDLKLRKDKNGNVEIRERFWNFNTIEENQKIVPPLLVYADLIATGDARNVETAKMIYDDYLERHIGEN
jgi:hypothetical protein